MKIIRFFTILIFLSLFQSYVVAQWDSNIDKLKSNFAKAENKEKYYTNLVKNVEYTLATSIAGNTRNWIGALRQAQSIRLNNNKLSLGLKRVLSLKTDNYRKLQRVALEVACSFDFNSYIDEITNILNKTRDPISFSISTHYLINSKINYENNYFADLLVRKFPKYEKEPILRELFKDLSFQNNYIFPSQSQLNTLINHDFQNSKTIVYSFFRKNRKYKGLTIVKDRNGNFVKNEDGNLFSIPQLALSYSNLPSYIPNGNTPQGIYSIKGWYISPTETIGPTPNLLLRSPFEVDTKIFFHNVHQKNWSLNAYKSLLPESLVNYSPLFKSYYAGEIGRKLIIVHGSTDEIKYYKNQPCFPLIPTRGCLSSYEKWSELSGNALESDQLRLINAYKSTKQKFGFLVVIELNNLEFDVGVNEIEEIIKKALKDKKENTNEGQG